MAFEVKLIATTTASGANRITKVAIAAMTIKG